jgi:hypothetical protein
MKFIKYASANCAELWCGWNRAEEIFQLQTEDVSFCLHEHDEQFSLPPGVGAIFLRLAPETNSSPDKPADIILSSHCASGLQPFFGLKESICLRELHCKTRSPFFFCNPD